MILPFLIAGILIYQNARLNVTAKNQANDMDTLRTILKESNILYQKRVKQFDSLRTLNIRRDSLVIVGLKNLGAYD